MGCANTALGCIAVVTVADVSELPQGTGVCCVVSYRTDGPPGEFLSVFFSLAILGVGCELRAFTLGRRSTT